MRSGIAGHYKRGRKDNGKVISNLQRSKDNSVDIAAAWRLCKPFVNASVFVAEGCIGKDWNFIGKATPIHLIFYLFKNSSIILQKHAK